MIAAAFLVLTGFALWVLFLIIQYAALLSLVALALGQMMAAAVYGASFIGFGYLNSKKYTDWTIFAPILLISNIFI